MLDLDRFIVEIDRVTKAIYFYDEIFGKKETIKIFNQLLNSPNFLLLERGKMTLLRNIYVTLLGPYRAC